MPQLPERNYVEKQSIDLHGEFAVISKALPNRTFQGKNGAQGYDKPQLEVTFLRDGITKIWTPDGAVVKKFSAEKGTNTDAWVGAAVQFRVALLANGNETVIGLPVSAELARSASQQKLGGASAPSFPSQEAGQ